MCTSENNKLSSIATSSMDSRCHALVSRHEETPDSSLVQCDVSQNGESRRFSSDPIIGTSSDSESHHEVAFYNRVSVHNGSGKAAVFLCTPNEVAPQITECSDVQATPGTIMWARTADQMWWPAKIMEGSTVPVVANAESVERHVLVQYYGSREVAWIDAAGNLSEFDECFEERSCNPLKTFQDALEEALHNNEDLASCGQMNRNSGTPRNSSLHEQAVAQSNNSTESSSSREEDDYRERGRGKRNRKPKLHFDEVIVPKRSTKKMRRFRIMRSLGLTPPVGSPFSFTSSITDC